MIDIADSPLAAWRAALSTPDLGVALCALVVGLGIPELLPQHVRPPPEYKLARPHGESAYVPSPLLLEPYIPDAQQAVPEAALWLLCVLIPFSIALALSFAAPGRGAVRAWLLGYIWTMALQGLIIGCINKYVGYWRPYYYAECGWDEKTGLCADPAAAAGDAVCQSAMLRRPRPRRARAPLHVSRCDPQLACIRVTRAVLRCAPSPPATPARAWPHSSTCHSASSAPRGSATPAPGRARHVEARSSRRAATWTSPSSRW